MNGGTTMTVLSTVATILGMVRDVAIIGVIIAYTLWGPNSDAE